MKRVLAFIVTVVLGYLLILFYWSHRNPLSRYGVSYEIETGESPSFNLVHFYWKREGQRIEGPVVIGDALYVKFSVAETGKVPDIEVRSEVNESAMVVLRLNFNDSSKPEFEIAKNNMLTIRYAKMGLIWP